MSTSKNIERLISKIIPPEDYQHRNGFSNEHLIDKLNVEERGVIENELIKRLQEKADMLMVETLSYMKSDKSLITLYELLENLDNEVSIIITASSIFDINQDLKMIEVAKTSFRGLTDKYQLIATFHYMMKFKNSEILKLIKEYTKDSDYLISYNAKQVLGAQ